jgi:hypothetical protein
MSQTIIDEATKLISKVAHASIDINKAVLIQDKEEEEKALEVYNKSHEKLLRYIIDLAEKGKCKCRK